MNLMHAIRRYASPLARLNAALFVLMWLSIIAAPCVMAMQVDELAQDHDCPHCPPTPCQDMRATDCDEFSGLDKQRPADPTQTVTLAAPAPFAMVFDPRASAAAQHPIAALPPSRAGPRPHLIHAQFNE
ncbi:MAG: hypothetical protein RQ741_13010 [Wenzhouxiangellaceae bacterium]|nr:hypothetical protein [Wenzhouxiangellaceae bacterium]